MLKHCFFGVWKTQYDFLLWDTWPYAQKHFFFQFLEVLTKTEYCHIGFCIFSNIKILPDINQNDIKNTRENYKKSEKYFLNVFFFIPEVGQTRPKSVG